MCGAWLEAEGAAAEADRRSWLAGWLCWDGMRVRGLDWIGFDEMGLGVCIRIETTRERRAMTRSSACLLRGPNNEACGFGTAAVVGLRIRGIQYMRRTSFRGGWIGTILTALFVHDA